MGIKSINAILSDKAPKAFVKMKIGSFTGRRIAIDGNNWIYSRRCVVYKAIVNSMPDPLCEIKIAPVISGVLNEIISFSSKLMSYGIVPVWCWDGKSLPDKEICKKKRSSSKKSLKERIDNMRVEIESVGLLDRTPEMFAKFKKLISQQSLISNREMDTYRNAIEKIGIPSITAPYEGEKLCANLARERLVAAVWSTDTDNYPLGTPLTIRGFDGRDQNGSLLVKVTVLQWILEEINFTMEKFIDFCICLGCDFNSNMRGVGPKRTWALFQKYNTIDEIKEAEPHRQIEVLRHQRCREIFTPELTGYVANSKVLRFNLEREIVDENGLNLSYYRHLILQNFENVSEQQKVKKISIIYDDDDEKS